jgi:hypothetical protein
MLSLKLDVEDLANMRFGISPLTETVFSLWALSDPSRHTLHLPWLRTARHRLDPRDAELLLSLVGPSRIPPDFRGNPSQALPDFLTPRPDRFVARFEDELAAVRTTAPEIVRRDLVATHAPDPLPTALRALKPRDDRATSRLLLAICDALERHWTDSLAPSWPQMQLVLEADTTYRAGRLAAGGARLLFADMHPNIRWSEGTLTVAEMISGGTVAAAGRGLLLIPSIFAYKPVPPLDPGEPPSLGYPSRGVGTLWSPPPRPEPSAVMDLLGRPRTLLLQMLEEPLPTVELARRLRVTPSAVSQHLRVLHGAGLVTRARDRRQVLYRRSGMGDALVGR